MNERAQQVLQVLKPAAKQYGFSKEDLESVAADIANNLAVEDDASGEDVQKAIDGAVASAIPYLSLAQKQANRVIEKNKPTTPKSNPNPESANTPKPDDIPGSSDEETRQLLRSLVEQNNEMREEISKLKGDIVTDGRKAQLQSILKDTGTFGKRVIKDFERQKFDTEDDFETYVEGVKEDLAAMNQERANIGLSKLGAPKANDNNNHEPAPLNETQIDSIAAAL